MEGAVAHNPAGWSADASSGMVRRIERGALTRFPRDCQSCKGTARLRMVSIRGERRRVRGSHGAFFHPCTGESRTFTEAEPMHGNTNIGYVCPLGDSAPEGYGSQPID